MNSTIFILDNKKTNNAIISTI